MQYQLSDDLPYALPFRLFPTIERDNGGRSDPAESITRVQLESSSESPVTQSSTGMFLDSSVWPALNTLKMTHSSVILRSVLFFSPLQAADVSETSLWPST